ncbi:uncharacterized protein KY384_000038 [Bacidia gigantensis]|uniref:uncharacterized protein n=1 Tax=Bacidia gigantensis TaxID=2732470 RepID=UPI001D0405E6|nr:uncharacterized protein KY384_000038 [Bacidia gigantensis]KAG8526445.1 hypothetical protein KY384_000038 [Bacidia gigantensis]
MAITELNSHEQENSVQVIQKCLANPGGLKVDYDIMQRELNYNTKQAAKSAWGRVRRKIMTPNSPASSGRDSRNKPTSASATPNATPRKKRERESDEEELRTPSKKEKRIAGNSKDEKSGEAVAVVGGGVIGKVGKRGGVGGWREFGGGESGEGGMRDKQSGDDESAGFEPWGEVNFAQHGAGGE